MNTTTPADLEAMARMYFSDKMSQTIGYQFFAVTFDAVFFGVLVGQTLKWIPWARHDASHIRYLRTSDFNVLLNGFTIIPVEFIFADRAIRINNKNPFLATVILLLIAGTTACTIGSLVTSRGHTMFDGTPLMVSFFMAQSAVCAAMHITVTSAICFGLWKNREGSRRTNRLIDKIIWITLEGQLPGTIIAILAFLLAFINIGNPFIPWLLVVHPKMYMMGCLAMINTRHSWSAEGRLLSSNSNSNSSSSGLVSDGSRRTLSTTTSSQDQLSTPPLLPRRTTVYMVNDLNLDERDLSLESRGEKETHKSRSKSKSRSSYRGSFVPQVSDVQLGSKVSLHV